MPKVIHTKLNFVLRRLFQREPLGLYSYLKRFKGRRSSTFNNYIHYYRNWRILGSSATLSFLVLSGLFIAPLYHQEPLGLAIGTAAETSLTLSSTSNKVSVSVTPSSSTGTFASSSIDNSAKFTVTSTNYTGYNLTLTPSSSNDTNQTLSSTNSDDIFTSITDTDGVSSTNFASSSYTSLNNKWGIAYGTTTAYDTFYPASSTLTVGSTTSANGSVGHSAESDIYYIGLGVRASQDQTATTYNNTNSNNTYMLTATGNKVAYTINFSSYESDVPASEVSNLPTALSSSTSSTSVQITNDKTPTRTGYTFKSWCLGTTSNSGATCNGTTYNVGDIFPINQTTTNISTLYAVWTINSYTITVTNNNTTSGKSSFTVNYKGSSTITVTPNNGYYLSSVTCPNGFTCSGYSTGTSYTGQQTITVSYNNATSGGALRLTGTIAAVTIAAGESTPMQNISSKAAGGCPSTLTTGTAYKLTDSRDNNVYYVARLADGNCWMLDNLRLNPANITLANLKGQTNASNTALEYFKGSRTGTSSDRYATAAVAASNSVANYSAPLVNVTQVNATTTGYGSGSKKRGVYYNYCAASAGYYCWGNVENTSDGSEDEDICPAGWRMPTGGSSGEYQALYDKYNSTQTAANTASLQYNLATPLSGFCIKNGTFNEVGSYGGFWSSTRSASYNMYGLGVNSSGVYPQLDSSRSNGLPVRCLLK